MEQNDTLENQLGPLVSLLANIKGIKQTTLAERCQISRISVNRFFRGKSQLGAADLVKVLQVLGFDLRGELSAQLSSHLQHNQAN